MNVWNNLTYSIPFVVNFEALGIKFVSRISLEGLIPHVYDNFQYGTRNNFQNSILIINNNIILT